MPDPDDDDRTLAGDDAGPARAHAQPIGRGATLGRYVVLEQLGAGGMGVVLAAYDPQLDRKVALKLLHAGPGEPGSSTSAGVPRLLREAQALAKLAHPNVITIHDVGVVDGAVFLAMEFVEGPTLGSWAREHRAWREIVATYVAAGRGLAAAHRAGFVHRDFKPDNVMIGKDGRPRVLDFGLARTTGEADPRELEPAELDAASAAWSTSSRAAKLTMTGALLGTPAYMAPEQFGGQAVDARSDQFAFCVALYEALYGQRPFAGANPAALALAVTSTAPREPPSGSDVPRWLLEVVLRGLARTPAQRWPSMDALLEALERDPTRTRRAWLAGLAALALLIGLALALRPAPSQPPCRGAAQQLVGVWDPATRTRLAAAFDASGAAFASDSFRSFATTLDAYAQAWTTMHRDACEATHVRIEQSDEVLDLRMACLERSRAQLATLVEVYARPDAAAVERSLEAAESLPPLHPCADVEGLMLGVRPPATPALAREVERLRAPIDRARSLGFAGQFAEASALVVPLLPEVEATGYRPLLAEAEFARGLASENPSESVPALERAVWMAEASRHDRLAAIAWIQLIKVYASGQNEFERAMAAVARADAAIERIGGDEDLRIRLDVAHGFVLDVRGDNDGALVLLRSARARRVARGQAHTTLALNEVVTLTNALLGGGFDNEARVLLIESIAQGEQALGVDHPWIARLRSTLGRVEYQRGDYGEAERQLRAALAVFERHGGPSSPMVAGMLNGLALVLDEQRRFDEARALYRRAIAIFEANNGPRHLNVAKSLNNLAELELETGELAAAREHIERSLAIQIERLDDDDPGVAWTRGTLADIELRLGHADAADRLYRRALAHAYTSPSNPDLAIRALRGLGELAWSRGELDEARRLLELGRSFATLLGPGHVGMRSLAELEFVLARLLAHQGEPARARALARSASGRYLTMTLYYQPERDAIAAWLTTLPPTE